MALTLCTLTGVDDATDLGRLTDLAAEFPFVEFGVLYSESQAGEGRYPTKARIREMAKIASDKKARLALHVCGRAVGDLFMGEGEVGAIADAFPRIQMNFAWPKYPAYGVAFVARDRPTQTIITQNNSANSTLWQELKNWPNHAVLFDASGGRGIAAAVWPIAFPGVKCGYAGGLGPGNIEVHLPDIEKASGGADHWIDMEGRLRIDDRLDLDLCRQVLVKVATHMSAVAD